MSTVPLHCTICPKRPDFSDISHLLTHVSSKGHLSHLHKLQVRSHQEANAGQQLTVYNNWYHKNGIGQLLSERLLQKQAKRVQGRKRSLPANATYRRRLSTVSRPATDPGLIPGWGVHDEQVRSQSSISGFHGRAVHLADSREHSMSVSIKSDDESDYDSSPLLRHGKRKGTQTNLTFSINPPQSPGEEQWTDGEPPGAELDDPDQSRLKGIYWPGMSIFDSASDEMKKKRNQKKDGSLLKQMEKTSEIVEPQEVIYSPQGSLAKIRTITGMVEDSSPLKGESPIPKKRLPKPRRPALAPISGNVVHRPRREARSNNTKSKSDEQRDIAWQDLSSYELRSSSHNSFHQSSAFMPTEDENREFKLTIGNLKPRSSGVQVFNEPSGNTSTNPKLFPRAVDGLQDYRMPALTYGAGSTAQPGLNAGHGQPWLRPPNSQPGLPGHLFSPESFSPRANMTSIYNCGLFKENADPFMPRAYRPASYNTFEWDGLPGLPDAQQHRTLAASTQGPSMTHPNAILRHDTSGFGVNPLSFAFQKLQEPSATFAGGGNLDEPNRPNGFISPNGTISDPGNDLAYQF